MPDVRFRNGRRVFFSLRSTREKNLCARVTIRVEIKGRVTRFGYYGMTSDAYRANGNGGASRFYLCVVIARREVDAARRSDSRYFWI